MVTRVPGRKTVYVLHRVRKRSTIDSTKWARDSRGNAVYADVRTAVSGCSVQPTGSSEDRDEQRTEVRTTHTIIAPLHFPGDVEDSVEIDGNRYNIVARPQRWEHPRIGHVVVSIAEVNS